ncbi:MAG: chromate efflux transporter [Solirubrobacteraceae bacterium]
MSAEQRGGRVSLRTVASDWTRIGLTGFGGPPAHISLLRQLVVERRRWIDARAFEDAITASSLLPGPASTQLAIYCAYRVGGPTAAIVGGLGFIAPAVAIIIALSVLFLGTSPPTWVRGAGAGAGAAVAAVALRAGLDLIRPSYRAAGGRSARRIRWGAYLLAGAVSAALVGPYLALVLVACGLTELLIERRAEPASPQRSNRFGILTPAVIAKAGVGPLAWTAFKVGALSFGGGFVIIPLMQGDAVHTYHWMTSGQFLNAVALGQVTPGPVVATVAAVGYAAHGVAGGLLAALVAFVPSFTFVLVGSGRFERLRDNSSAVSFLNGAGPAAIGAILGAAIPLTRALSEPWQAGVLAVSAVSLLVLRRGVVQILLVAGLAGVLVAVAGAPVP